MSSENGLRNKLRVLFRPQRWKYVKRSEPDPECPFCRATRLGILFESLVVFKTDRTQVLLNKFPYNTGHLLVVPIRHEGDFLGLTQSEFEDLNYCLRISVAVLKSVYEPHGFNLGLNLERAAGAGLPEHLHYHIVPRFHGDLNFFPLIAESKVIPESLEDTYEKVKEGFSKISTL